MKSIFARTGAVCFLLLLIGSGKGLGTLPADEPAIPGETSAEAFRATFELGGDGNEFDIRITRDGVLVVFHDDMLDRLLEAYGDVSEFTWKELQHFRFRNPGRFGAQCRIPTLVEVFDL